MLQIQTLWILSENVGRPINEEEYPQELLLTAVDSVALAAPIQVVDPSRLVDSNWNTFPPMLMPWIF